MRTLRPGNLLNRKREQKGGRKGRARVAGGRGSDEFGLLFRARRRVDGVAQDDAEATRFFRLAADQGQTDAEYNLGCAYANGTGVARDNGEAVRWLERAAAKGFEGAKTALAQIRPGSNR